MGVRVQVGVGGKEIMSAILTASTVTTATSTPVYPITTDLGRPPHGVAVVEVGVPVEMDVEEVILVEQEVQSSGWRQAPMQNYYGKCSMTP